MYFDNTPLKGDRHLFCHPDPSVTRLVLPKIMFYSIAD